MSDHGFNIKDLWTSEKAIETAANEISKESGVVAVHIAKKVGAEGHYRLITLGDEVKELDEVIAAICSSHSVKIRSSETWLSKQSFRNGKKTTNAFV